MYICNIVMKRLYSFELQSEDYGFVNVTERENILLCEIKDRTVSLEK